MVRRMFHYEWLLMFVRVCVCVYVCLSRPVVPDSFDAAEPELVGAYLILALYWMHQMDPIKIARYIGLAHQSNGIIGKPPPELVASLTFISVVLFDAHVRSRFILARSAAASDADLAQKRHPPP